MITSIRHVSLFIPSLREAEAYYATLFTMELIARECLLDDGEWYTLRPPQGWKEVTDAGIEVAMVALRNGALVMTLFEGDPQPGQLHMIGLNMPREEIAALRSRLPSETEIWVDKPQALTFRDRYTITWQIYAGDTPFRSNGELYERWLDL